MAEQYLDATTLILLFTVYYFVERLLRYILRARNEPFYASLRASRKDTVFFGISMGLLISLASTPSCARGAWNAWNALGQCKSSCGSTWFLDEDAQMCVTARAVLWVSELNRLDLYPLYIVHHAGALLSLLSFLYLRWPVVPILTIFATLASEVPGDALWMLSAYIDSLTGAESSHLSPSTKRLQTLRHRLNTFNILQYALLRGASILFVVWLLAFNPFPAASLRTHAIPMQIYAYVLLGLYAAFCAGYGLSQYRSICAYRRATALEAARRSGLDLNSEKV
ncbi:hypothetical protein C8F01DRAFT_1281736 [Mycena amicta]|nr:hypothetical protein C8F01DRAFT_1281736 [Mycena amicta]